MKNILSYITPVFDLIRYWQWYDKVSTNILAALLLLIYTDNIYARTDELITFIMYLFIIYSYGYLLNSYTDRKEDMKVGKNYFGTFSERSVKIIILFLGASTVIIPIFFIDVLIVALLMVGLLFATFYSLKPLRLKERGLLSIFIPTITQRLPFLFFFIIEPTNPHIFFYLMGWLVLIGLITEFAHQAGDYLNDKNTNVKTFAVRFGIPLTTKYVHAISALLIIYLTLPSLNFSLQGVALTLILLGFSSGPIHFAQLQLGNINQRLEG